MNFKRSGNFTDGERTIWEVLKQTYQESDDDGKAYHKFPITRDSANSYEPDILLVSRGLGVLVIEVKDCRIENIGSIEGYTWYMEDWRCPEETPFVQAKDMHMYALKDRIQRSSAGVLVNEQGDLAISFNYLVCLPLITEQQWLEKLGTFHDHTKIIFQDSLSPEIIRVKLTSLPNRQGSLTDDQYIEVLRIITGSSAITRNPGLPIPDQSSRGYYLRECRKETNLLDDRQVDIAYCIPPAPQRIRGLAGSGKTVVLAAKIAYMKSKNPDWKILCTYSTRSLKNAFTDLIRRFLHQIDGDY
jgi:hypothetical protein